MEAAGIEPRANSSGKRGVGCQGGAESGAIGASLAGFPSDLQAITEAWPELSEVVKAAFMAILAASTDGKR